MIEKSGAMTNYDWIHALSLEEMVKAHVLTGCHVCAFLFQCPRGDRCDEGHRLWLEQEHSTDERR